MNKRFFFPTLGLLALLACNKNMPPGPPPVDHGDLSDIPYSPKAYTIMKPANFPEVPVPVNNPMTYDGVQLGRRLFYDPILSGDSTLACAGCHMPAGNFTDNFATSKGIDGKFGNRSTMVLLDAAYSETTLDEDTLTTVPTDFFWDGRARSLEDQALGPVENVIEMHNTWTNAVSKLRTHATYPSLFRKAFGITNKSQITKELATKAIAQFERILISSGQSKFDRGDLDDDETDGYIMGFFNNGNPVATLPDAQCFHCHGAPPSFTGPFHFFDNGLQDAATISDYKDIGRAKVTNNLSDYGKFRAPTLRNIALSAPYMHDGRFKTLEEVLDHYARHGHPTPNLDPFMPKIGFLIPNSNPLRHDSLSIENRQKIVKFLKCLTDTTFIHNPDIQNPFH